MNFRKEKETTRDKRKRFFYGQQIRDLKQNAHRRQQQQTR